MMTVIKCIAYALGLAFVQAAVVTGLFLLSGTSDLPLLIIVCAYFLPVALIQRYGHFVGCANMVEPFLLGVPIGIAAYSLIGSLMITAVTRLVRPR